MRGDGPRHRLARHRHARVAARGRRSSSRRSRRGRASRSPARRRSPTGMGYIDAAQLERARPARWRKNGYGQYLLALLREPVAADEGHADRDPRRAADRAAACSATSAASSSRAGTARAFAAAGHRRRRSCRTTTRARAAACCAACTTRSSTRRASSCACVAGEVFDVAVDLRRSVADLRPLGRRRCCPPTNQRMLWVPPGFAHGFVVLSETAEFLYKTTDYWFAGARAHAAVERPGARHRLAARRRAGARGQGRRGHAARRRETYAWRERTRMPADRASSSPAPAGRSASSSRAARAARRRRRRRSRRARPRRSGCDRRGVREIAAAPDRQRGRLHRRRPGRDRSRARRTRVNARAPGVLADEAKRAGAVLIHYSTDYVFDGAATAPYAEDAPTAPLNVYGATKLAGERAIAGARRRRARPAHQLGVRLRGAELPAHHAPARGASATSLRIVADQTGAPNWCRELARATARIVADGLPALASARGSITCRRPAARRGTTSRARSSAKRGPTRVAADHDRRLPDAGASARATACSTRARFERTFGFGLPPWRDALARCVASPAEPSPSGDSPGSSD